MLMKKSIGRRFGRIGLTILALILLAVIGYVAYLLLQYSRIEDNLPLEVAENAAGEISADQEYTIVTWNLGFGAYSADYSFFMDGGKESRAYSKDAVYENISGAIERLNALNPDLMLLQEIDTDSTRSYHVNERELLETAFPEKTSVFAVNYHSAYLMYPFTEPHGQSNSGILTFSDFEIQSSVRRSLPIETGLTKFLDLDRCYSVSRIPVANGKTLCLYNLHLSAYTTDGTIANDQLEMLLADMRGEYESGNYVVGGGDFNKDLLGNSAEVFGVSGGDYTWAQSIPESILGSGVELEVSENLVPSCRNTDIGYEPGKSFVVTVDGFLVSDNVEVTSVETVDAGFAVSDHNPVKMVFRLIG